MGKVLNVHFMSKKQDWATPQTFFDKYNKVYNFTLDVCASAGNKKVSKYFDEKVNGLIQPWGDNVCWMNPPYGREIGKWVKKAYEESLNGAIVVCLLPARTDTKWFHEYCAKGRIEFIKGRLKFEGAANSAPFPSMVAVFGKT
jgi:phage N-6-adenine-methyltransferase